MVLEVCAVISTIALVFIAIESISTRAVATKGFNQVISGLQEIDEKRSISN